MAPRPRKVTYVISDQVDRNVQFEWIADSRVGREFELSYVVMNARAGSSLERHLRATGCSVHHVPFSGKKQLPSAILRLALHFGKNRPDVVHAHLTGANLGALPAARLARIATRIYTRHHSTFHHDYHPHAVAYDRLANSMATDIIATCENGRQVLSELEQVPASKIHVINIGFRLDEFEHVPAERVEALRDKYDLNGPGPVVGLISKYAELKGIQYAIPAFEKVLARHPQAVLLLANARDSAYKPVIEQLLARFPKERFRQITFEADAPALFHAIDVFVHVPVDARVEAFGQVYVEALAAGTPSVVTRSGIANELIEHRRNAWVVPFRDTAAIAEGVLGLLADPELVRGIVARGKADVRERFGFERMIDRLVELYNLRAAAPWP